MKKLLLTITFLAVIAISCKDKKNDQNELEIQKLEQEFKVIDSTASLIKNTKIEIEKSSKELEELISNL